MNNLINLFLTVLLISLIFSTPFIVLILLMEFYDKYKKRKNKENKEAERIIIKNNEQINKDAISLQIITETYKKLEYSVLKLREEKRALLKELEIDDPDVEELTEEPEEEKIDYSKMTINELHDIARKLNIKGFSRMKKEKLVSIVPLAVENEQSADKAHADKED